MCPGQQGNTSRRAEATTPGPCLATSPLPEVCVPPEVCLPRARRAAEPFPGRLQPGCGRPFPRGALVTARCDSGAVSGRSAAFTNTVQKIQLLLNVLFLSRLQSRAFLRLKRRQSKVFFLPSQQLQSSLGTVLAACVLPCRTRAALMRFAQNRPSRPPGHIPGCLLLPAELCFCLPELPSKFLRCLCPELAQAFSSALVAPVPSGAGRRHHVRTLFICFKPRMSILPS